MCPRMEINGRADVVRADVEVVIRVKRHTRLLDAIQGYGRGKVVSKRGFNAATVAAQL